jgi:hypothetical protein
MSWWKWRSLSSQTNDAAGRERRRDPRIGGHFKVRYSGSYDGEIVMGYASIVNLSRYGFGLTGARGLQLGMELVLFLELSDMSESLCIPDAYVSWVDGRRFGVELRAARDKEPVWLERLAG